MKLKNLAKKVKKALLKGFSLIEMLVVIAVIGVITAVAVPAISAITQQAENAKNQRNAQNVASIYNAAIAAGYAGGEATVGAAIDNLQVGVTGTGEFTGTTFLVDIEDGLQQTECENLLQLNANIMTFQ